MNIQQIRAKYPQYKDLSDTQLADALHAKFYSDLPIQDYYSRIGLVPPETTIGGQAKELVKGLIPGAVGLVEQAAIGASALLPEDYEKPTRETIAKVAGAVKAPFAAAPGYEESVGRKLGEAVGSTAPFLLAGPLGLAGRAAALGLGVGAGAGEARTRAEKEGATAEQRATATALGIIPGAAEVFAPFRILSRIPDAATAQGVQLVKRALLAGGEEAAQEAASGFAQNLIAKGVYKPEQELIEGLGEQAAYGGATGAIVQGLMDLALGRRARGAEAPPTGEAPIDKAVREAQPPAPPTAPAAPAGVPPLPDTYAELVLYGEQVKQLPKSKERDEALKAAREKREAIIAEEVKQNRLSAEKAKEFLTAEEAAAAEIQRRDELETEAPAEPTPAAVPEPTVVKKGEPPPTGLQSTDIEALGISKKQPIYKRLLGKDMDDPTQRDAALADIENYLVKGYGSEESRANLTAFKERFAPVAEPALPEVPSDTAIVEPAGGAGVAVVGEPGAGAAPAGAGVPEPSGMVPAVADVGEPVAGEGQQPPAVAPTPAAEETPISAPPPAVEATAPAPAPIETAPPPAAEAAAPAPAPKKVLRGKVENQVKALGVNAAQGGVPDPKVIRETLEPIDPKMARAVMFYLGVDYDGNFLVGANNLPQTPSAQEAGKMAGLGENSGDRVKKVATALGITGDIRRKYQASQTDVVVTGRASESSQSRVSQEANTGKLIKNQLWYQPIARKGVSGANDTELARAAVKADRLLSNPANEPVYAELAAEVEKRKRRPEFAAAIKRELGIRSEATTVEEGTPGTEEAFDDETPELPQRPTPGVTSPGITRAVNESDTRRALQAIRETPEATPLDHEVAQRFLGLGQFLGFPKIETRPKDQIKGSGQYNAPSDTVSIAAGEEDTHTVLHEVTHAFVHKLIVANEKGLRNDAGYRDLKQLYDYLKKTYPALEKEYGMSNVTEFASEAMSNPQFQKKLGTIRYKTRAAWSQFVQAVRKLLKIGAGDSSALIEAMAGVDSLLRVGREYQKTGPDIGAGTVSVITPESEATAKELDAIGERKQDRFRDKVGRQLKGNAALRLREKLTDSLAPMEDFFVKAYGGAIRTEAGRLNPMVLLSRALDSGRVSKAAQIEGGLARKDGLIVAAELKNAEGRPVSYSGVLNRIAETAKTQNKTYEEYRKTIDNILYGHREHGLRQKAREMEQQAQALEAAGKKDKAKALRDDIPTLLLNDAQIDRAEAAFQQDPFIKEVLADLDTIRFNMLDMLVETGRISAEQAQDYKDAVGYIPFERIGEYENAWTGATRGANRGVAALKKVRDFEGSERKSTSVIENFSGLMDWGTSEAMKNEAGRRALEDMELLGAAQRRDKKPAEDSPGGVVTVFENGKPASFYVPDPAHLATFSMADPQLSNIIKGLSLATRTLRAGVTSMPPFAIKQVFDDIVRAYAYAGVKNNGELVKNVLFNFPKNWFNEVFKRKTDSVRDLERLGIVGTFDFTQHTNLKDILRESGAQKEGLAHNILRVMEAGAKASDISVREAVYKQVMKETGDAAQAESAAREIINFSRRGSSKFMNTMISIIPFFNAYARGMDKLATAAAGGVVGQSTGTARSMFYKRMGVLTAMGLTYALLMQDDEEYEALPDHVRDTNWVLPYGKHLGFTPAIPIPAELAFFFKAIPERVVRYYKYQGTEDEQAAVQVLGELAKRGVDVFSSPNLMAQGIRPLVENTVNYSFFLGRPLESAAQLKLRPAERYGIGTSGSMKALAEMMDTIANATGIETFAISPIKLENALRGLFGTAAGLALTMSDMLINPNRTDRPMHQQLATQLTGASALMKSPVGTRYMDVIYDLENRTEQVNSTYNRMLQTKPDKAEEFLQDNIGLFSIRGPLQGIMESIRTLNEAAQMIDRDTTLSPQERRQRIDELRVQQNEIARQVYMLRNLARNTQRGF